MAAAVAFDPLKDVTVTYSVSSVTLHVSVNHTTCCKTWKSSAITQEEQLVLTRGEEVIRLGDAVMVPEENDVVFAKEELDRDIASKANLDLATKGRSLCLPEMAIEPVREIRANGNRRPHDIAIAIIDW